MLNSGFNTNTTFKHYWKWDKKQQLNSSISLSYYKSKFNTLTYQKLDDDTINEFDSENFNVDTNYKFTRAAIETEYKWVKNKLEIKPSFHLQYNLQNIGQGSDYKQSKIFLLPKLRIQY